MEKGTTFIPLFLKIHSLNFAYDDTIRLSEYQLNIHLYKKFRDVVHVAVVPRYILKREKKKEEERVISKRTNGSTKKTTSFDCKTKVVTHDKLLDPTLSRDKQEENTNIPNISPLLAYIHTYKHRLES